MNKYSKDYAWNKQYICTYMKECIEQNSKHPKLIHWNDFFLSTDHNHMIREANSRIQVNMLNMSYVTKNMLTDFNDDYVMLIILTHQAGTLHVRT